MNLKNMFLMLLTGLLALVALAAAVFYFTQPRATAVAESQPPEIPAQVKENDMVSTGADQAEKKWPSATSNDITIQIISVKLTQKEMPITETLEDGSLHEYVYVFDLLEIGLCHTMLDNGDWVVWPDYLHYGNQSAFPWGLYTFEGEAQGEILADGKNTGERCHLLYYPVDDPETLSLPLKFAITSFGVPYNEGYSPCQNIERRWRTNPLAQEYGMKISCQDDFAKGPTVTLDDYSKSVSREDVQWVFNMLTTAEVPGYWEFVLTEIEP